MADEKLNTGPGEEKLPVLLCKKIEKTLILK